MADTIFKAPTGSSNKLVLQSGAGNSALEVLDGGNITLSGTLTAGTLGNNVNVANCIIKKWHHFTYTTRLDASGYTGVQQAFNWTTAFTPIDPVNNSLWVVGVVPSTGIGNDQMAFGLRFTKSGGGDTDFINKGTWATDIENPVAGHQTFQNYSFNIAAGTLSAGTYTIAHRLHQAGSQMKTYNPTTADNSRFNPQLTSELMIREYKNP